MLRRASLSTRGEVVRIMAATLIQCVMQPVMGPGMMGPGMIGGCGLEQGGGGGNRKVSFINQLPLRNSPYPGHYPCLRRCGRSNFKAQEGTPCRSSRTSAGMRARPSISSYRKAFRLFFRASRTTTYQASAHREHHHVLDLASCTMIN